MKPRLPPVAAALAALVAAGVALGAASVHTISQKDRQFQPRSIEIARGDTLRIVNDDGELLHHAYVDTPSFSFDSGEQEPGSRTDIQFTVAGQYVVLCQIHPKMHLAVTVK